MATKEQNKVTLNNVAVFTPELIEAIAERVASKIRDIVSQVPFDKEQNEKEYITALAKGQLSAFLKKGGRIPL